MSRYAVIRYVVVKNFDDEWSTGHVVYLANKNSVGDFLWYWTPYRWWAYLHASVDDAAAAALVYGGKVMIARRGVEVALDQIQLEDLP